MVTYCAGCRFSPSSFFSCLSRPSSTGRTFHILSRARWRRVAIKTKHVPVAVDSNPEGRPCVCVCLASNNQKQAIMSPARFHTGSFSAPRPTQTLAPPLRRCQSSSSSFSFLSFQTFVTSKHMSAFEACPGTAQVSVCVSRAQPVVSRFPHHLTHSHPPDLCQSGKRWRVAAAHMQVQRK